VRTYIVVYPKLASTCIGKEFGVWSWTMCECNAYFCFLSAIYMSMLLLTFILAASEVNGFSGVVEEAFLLSVPDRLSLVVA